MQGNRTVLDWRKGSYHDPPEPCSVCGVPTRLRSPRGIACHKVCAERWLADHGKG